MNLKAQLESVSGHIGRATFNVTLMLVRRKFYRGRAQEAEQKLRLAADELKALISETGEGQ